MNKASTLQPPTHTRLGLTGQLIAQATRLQAKIQAAEQSFEAGRPEVARDLASQAAQQARLGQHRHLLGWALMLLGRAEMRLDQPLAAHAAATEAYGLLRACGDVPRQLWALNTCATVQVKCGDASRSFELYRQGLAVAQAEGCAAPRCALLINLSNRLLEAAEHAEAVQCLREAVDAASQAPQLPGQWIDARSRLALAHVAHADALDKQGQTAAAQAQRTAAALALPLLNAHHWRGFSNSESYALWSQAEVLAALGRWAEARLATATALWSARRKGPLQHGDGFLVAAELHRRSGHLQRAIGYEVRGLALRRLAGDGLETTACLRRLVRLQALTQNWGAAVANQLALKAHLDQQQFLARALRCRLATLARQAERRSYQDNEAQLHSRRLAIIGRLIGQTHHALHAPIAQAHALAAMALALPLPSLSTTALAALLAEVNLCIDRAGDLVSQLKLFSYRSTPQPMALSLHAAMQNAWQGLSQHVGPRVLKIELGDDAPMQAWADAQRLGILLKVLLIELSQPDRALLVRASVAGVGLGDVCLCIQTESAQAVIHEDGQLLGPSLGITLCMEIAKEMKGNLTVSRVARGWVQHVLRLPVARA
jgi:hypothetical protein